MVELPTGTVTFLFTDLEASTRLWDEHPEAMRDALARHDAILRDSVERHAGHVVKTTGDGILAVHAVALDAVDAAADAIRALTSEAWAATGPLRVRMGIHTGSAEARDGDYFGNAPNRASRLMAAAHGMQIVLSQVSADLVRDDLRDGLELVDLGEHRLRGFAAAEHVFQLTIVGLPSAFPPLQSLDAFPGNLPLPKPAFSRGDRQLAGRSAELGRLEEAWDQARAGVEQVVLVAGEPGIGKTRLTAELSHRASAQGGFVLYGRCDEEAVVPYQPFVEALREYVAACAPSILHERLHGLESDLARLFPELVGRIPELAVPVSSEPETERFRLFEAVTALVTGISASQPTILVLDDLHWADGPTLLLFRHLLRSASRAALMIVVCYRDVELPRGHPLADLLADLRREPSVTWITLGGLSETETGDLLRALAGRSFGPSLAAALQHETGGNPFFLEELLQHLMETDALPLAGRGRDDDVDLTSLTLPEGVRDVVVRRLRRLPESVTDVLSVASAIGPDFDAALLGRATERPAAEVLESLDLAAAARLVHEHSGRMGWYAFSHALVRQTLYAELGSARRAQAHASVGLALEAGAVDPPAAVLALHYAQAVLLVGAPKAIEYTTRAGHEALADLAFEDAASYFERALALLEEHEPGDTAHRIELLTDLANALDFVDERAGVDTALRAVDAARAHGTPEQLARAVAVFAEPTLAVTAHPAEVVALLDEGLAALGDGHPALRARLMTLQAFKYAAHQLHGRDGRALAGAALALARTADDPVTLSDALFTRAVSLEGTADIAERVALGEELVGLGPIAGGRPWTFGLRVLAGAHLEHADADALTATIADLARVGDELRWPSAHLYATQWRATQALLEGRFDDVRMHGNEMRRYARAYRGVAGMQSVQAFYVAREQGELGNIAPLERIAEEARANMYSRAMLALAQLESGDEIAARQSLAIAAAADFHRGGNESAWPAGLALLSEVAVDGGDAANAAVLYELLSPFADRLLAALVGLACLGAADRYLGMLCTVLRRWDAAEQHFDRAVALEERIRGAALLVRTRYWQACFLRARGGPGDDRAARALFGSVSDETARLGMARLGAQAAEALAT